MNLRDEPVEHTFAIIGSPEISSEGSWVKYFKVEEDGNETPLFLESSKVSAGHLLESHEQTMTLEPKARIKAELRGYVNVWPVNQDRPYVHNSFASRQTCFINRLEIEGPIENLSVLWRWKDLKAIEENTDGFVYNIPSPMLAGEVLEVLLKFRPWQQAQSD